MWSGCTAPATPQTLTLGGSATWVDANTGTPPTAGPATAAVPVVAAAAVTATSIVATPATQTLVWTGRTAPATPQLLSISGFATWVDPNLPLVQHTTSVTSSTVRVLAPAALIVNFAAHPPSPVRVGQVVTLTAHVQNSAPAGGEAATGMIVTPSVTSVSGKAAAKCTAATPVSVAMTANGKAAGSGAALSVAATTAPPTTVLR